MAGNLNVFLDMIQIFVGIILIFFSSHFCLAKPVWIERSCVGLPRPDIKEYKIAEIPQGPSNDITFKDVQSVIPIDMAPSDNAVPVISKIGDRFFQKWMQSEAIKNSSMGRTASQVENAMKTEVVVAPTKSSEIEHKFSFQYQALQALAKLEYKGWTKAVMSFDARAGKSVVEVTEKVLKNKEFFLNQTKTSDQQLSLTGLRWNW